MLVCMRTTLNLDADLVERAMRLTGIKENTALVHAALEALVAHESARSLAALGGTMPKLRSIPRRRSKLARCMFWSTPRYGLLISNGAIYVSKRFFPMDRR